MQQHVKIVASIRTHLPDIQQVCSKSAAAAAAVAGPGDAVPAGAAVAAVNQVQEKNGD